MSILKGQVYTTDGYLPSLANGQTSPISLAGDGSVRVLSTSAGGSSAVEGTVADGYTAGGSPVEVGGVYRSDPTTSTLSDGYVGTILINEQRMVVNEDRAYDETSDANKNIPVYIPSDRYSFADLSNTTIVAGTFHQYISMTALSLFSLQFIPSVSDGYQSLTVAVSNEDVSDISSATYTDVTSDLFGASSFSTENYLEKDTPTSAKSLRVTVTVGSGILGTETWSLFLSKKAV